MGAGYKVDVNADRLSYCPAPAGSRVSTQGSEHGVVSLYYQRPTCNALCRRVVTSRKPARRSAKRALLWGVSGFHFAINYIS